MKRKQIYWVVAMAALAGSIVTVVLVHGQPPSRPDEMPLAQGTNGTSPLYVGDASPMSGQSAAPSDRRPDGRATTSGSPERTLTSDAPSTGTSTGLDRVRRSLLNREVRASILAQQRLKLRDKYPDLQVVLGLDANQFRALLDLLAEK